MSEIDKETDQSTIQGFVNLLRLSIFSQFYNQMKRNNKILTSAHLKMFQHMFQHNYIGR